MAAKRKASSSGSTTKPDLSIFYEPSQRSYIVWTPALVRAAEISADGGSLRLAADLCETMLGDDRLRAVLDTRCDGLLGLDLEFEAGVGRKKKQAVKALQAEEDFFAAFPESELRKLLAWGILLGVGVAEIQWTPRKNLAGGANTPASKTSGGDDERLVPVIEVKHPRQLRWDWQNRTWKLLVVTSTGEAATTFGAQSEIDITPGDGKWIVFTPYGKNRPWSMGPWRACSRWMLLKLYAEQDFATLGENAKGLRHATAPAGASSPMRQQLANDIDSLGATSTIVFPNGVDFKITALTLANSKDIYESQISIANLAFTISLLGNNLTTEAGTKGSGGSHSGSQAQKDGPQLARVRSDGKTLSACLHDQVLTWWAEFNFGTRLLAPWPSWQTDPPEDLASKASTLLSAAQALAALEQLGVDIDPVLEDFGLERLPEEERPAPAAPAAPPGSPPPGQQPPPGADGKPPPGSPPLDSRPPPPMPAAAAAAASTKQLAGKPDPIGEIVWQQLEPDYPKEVLAWVLDPSVKWEGPIAVPLEEIDYSGRAKWTATQNPDRVADFADAITGGHMKPVVLVDEGDPKGMMIVDGHHRSLAFEKLGRPVLAYVAHVKKLDAGGAWIAMHDAQKGTASMKPSMTGPSSQMPSTSATAVELASGTSPSRRRGFVQGQHYADALAEDARDAARVVIADELAAVLDALDSASSLEDVKHRLLTAYKKMDPGKLAKKAVHPAMLMAHLAGRAAVAEDTER